MESPRKHLESGKVSRSKSFVVASQRLALQNEMEYFGDIFDYEKTDEELETYLQELRRSLSTELYEIVDEEFMDIFFQKISEMNRLMFLFELESDKKKMIVYLFEFSSGRQRKKLYKHILRHYKDLIKHDESDMPLPSPPASPMSLPGHHSYLREKMEKRRSDSHVKKYRLSLTLLPEFKWEIKGHDILYPEPPMVIGTGACGDVYLGKFRNKRVAIKKIPSEDGGDTFLNEISILCKMDHPNIVKVCRNVGIGIATVTYFCF